MTTPRIGYTARERNREYFLKWRTAYWYAIAMFGGDPVPIYPDDDLDALCPTLDGVILTGGGDVHPRRFGQEPAGTKMESIHEEQDEQELAVARRAAAAGKPLLGICRGIQVMNVALGGGLIQHVEGHAQVINSFDGPPTQHAIRVEEGSLLARTLQNGASNVVNTYHHQVVAADDIAPGLRATAWAEDGMVEALEMPGHPYYIGVQWHPERMYEIGPEHRNLFRALIEAAKNGR
jgi:putative glutamine amidotransferase